MADSKEIGERLSLARKKKGLTQEQLSGLSGVKRASIANYERGAYAIPLDIAEKLCRFLNISANELLFDIPTITTNNVTLDSMQKERDEFRDKYLIQLEKNQVLREKYEKVKEELEEIIRTKKTGTK